VAVTAPAGDGYLLLRYKRDGALDSSFGDGGIVTILRESSCASSGEVIVQPDRRILLVGSLSDVCGPRESRWSDCFDQEHSIRASVWRGGF
jgi:hypothetical protein